ncbi:hypothetical protein [Mycolicibacterium sphagni]|nr:hypothetical protein [Mycolicibacterium sphagni]
MSDDYKMRIEDQGAFRWLRRCWEELSTAAFATSEAWGPDEPVKLSQADCQDLLDAMHGVQMAWMHWRRFVPEGTNPPPSIDM